MKTYQIKLQFPRSRVLEFGFFLSIVVPLLAYAKKISTWGIDPLQDAAIIVPTIALRDGFNLYSDVMEYKGPVGPVIYNFLLPGNLLSVANMKFLTYIFGVIASFLSYLILKKINREIAVIVPSIWILSNPANSLLYSKPWPGQNQIDPGLFLNLVLMLILFLVVRNRLFDFTFQNSWQIFALSVLLSICVLTRIQCLFLFVLWIFICTVMQIKSKLYSRTAYLFNLFLLILIPIIFFAYLVKVNALDDWFYQIIQVPVEMRRIGDAGYTMSITTFFTRVFIFFVMSACLLIAYFIVHINSDFFRIKKSLINSSLMGCLLFVIYQFGLKNQVNPNLHLDFNNWTILVTQWSPNAIFYFVYLVLFAIPVLFLMYQLFAKTRRNSNHQLNVNTIFIYSIAFQGGIFLYPNIGNLWNYGLLVATALIHIFKNRFRKDFLFVQNIKIILVGICISMVVLNWQAFIKQRYEYRSPILKGISESSESLYLDSQLRLLNQLGWRKFVNLCDAGLLSVYDGHYHNLGPKFGDNNWNQKMNIDSYINSTPNIILCKNSIDKLDYFEKRGFKIEGKVVGNNLGNTYFLSRKK